MEKCFTITFFGTQFQTAFRSNSRRLASTPLQSLQTNTNGIRCLGNNRKCKDDKFTVNHRKINKKKIGLFRSPSLQKFHYDLLSKFVALMLRLMQSSILMHILWQCRSIIVRTWGVIPKVIMLIYTTFTRLRFTNGPITQWP